MEKDERILIGWINFKMGGKECGRDEEAKEMVFPERIILHMQ
jgi:hypothetical protein